MTVSNGKNAVEGLCEEKTIFKKYRIKIGDVFKAVIELLQNAGFAEVLYGPALKAFCSEISPPDKYTDIWDALSDPDGPSFVGEVGFIIRKNEDSSPAQCSGDFAPEDKRTKYKIEVLISIPGKGELSVLKPLMVEAAGEELIVKNTMKNPKITDAAYDTSISFAGQSFESGIEQLLDEVADIKFMWAKYIDKVYHLKDYQNLL